MEIKFQDLNEINILEDNLNIQSMKYPLLSHDDIKLKRNLKKYINFTKIIDNKKNEIKSMIKNKLGKTDFLYIRRKPSPLIKLEKGLKKYLFDLNGDFIKNFPFLRRKLINEKEKKLEQLEQKIDAGTLIYFYLKQNDKINDLKKNILKKSNNFRIKKDKDMIQEEFIKLKIEERHKRDSLYSLLSQNKEKNKSKIKSQSPPNKINLKMNNPNIINYKTQISFFSPNKKSRNNNSNDLFKLTSYNSNDNYKTPQKNKIQKIYLNTIDSSNKKINQSESFKSKITNTISTSSSRRINFYLSPKQKLKISEKIKEKKIMKKSLNEKVNLLQISTDRCNNKLFRLIDNSKISKKKNIDSIKTMDMLEVLDIKNKKEEDEKEFESTREIFSSANKDYFGLNKDKAELLSISDKISKLPDNVALYLIERFSQNYEKTSINIMDEITTQYSPLIDNLKNKNRKEMKLRLQKNSNKIIMLNASLDTEKDELKKLHKMIESKKESC